VQQRTAIAAGVVEKGATMEMGAGVFGLWAGFMKNRERRVTSTNST
jgi:hypothetical protein